jgi:hypothetical protein
MSTGWLTADDAMSGPVPIVWWNIHHPVHERSVVERVYTLSRQLSKLFWEPYRETIDSLVEVEGYTNNPDASDLMPVYVGGLLLSAMYRGQQ